MKSTLFLFQSVIIVLSILVTCPRAEAYVHLMYGSLVTQVILSGFLGLLVSTRKSFFPLLVATMKKIGYRAKS